MATSPGQRVFSSRPLIGLAWFNVVVHVVALVLAGVGMRPGSPLVPLEERMVYLAGAPVGWTLAWVAWMVSAAALIAFLAALTQRTGMPLAQLGLMIAVAGAGFDLFCDCVHLLILPGLASWQPPQEALFLTVERTTGIGSLVIGNGAYSVAICLIVHACRAQPGVTWITTAIGYGVGGLGLFLAAAGITGSAWHAALATPPTIGLFCVWVVLFAYSVAAARRLP